MTTQFDENEDWNTRRDQIIGLGENSARKSYYPELQQRLRELEKTRITLATANRQLQAVLDAASEISIIATDSKGMVTIFNSGAEKMFAYKAEEIAGHVSALFFHKASEVENWRCEHSAHLGRELDGFESLVIDAKAEVAETREWTYIRKDGSELLVALTITVIRDENGAVTGYLGIGKDITEQKMLEAKLLQSQKMESIGQLAGGLAHDFNNVLSVIIGFASLIQMKAKLDEPVAKMVDNIIAASKRGGELTHSLLAFSRKQIMNKNKHDLNQIVQNVGKFLKNLIGEDIYLKIAVTDFPLNVYVDGAQIEQVLMNLATNARDAMPTGGNLTIETSVQVIDDMFVKAHGYGEQGRYAVIVVSDTGRGMDDMTRKKIFEPFFTTKDVGRGTGLGLAMVYGIITQHNGYINVYSEPEIGTTFQISLPLVSSDGAVEELMFFNDEQLPGGSEVILLVEDEAPLRELMASMLTHFGYRVIIAVDGQDAVEKYFSYQDEIALLVMDMIMPRMSGKAAYDEIRKSNPAVKALFCSGYATDVIQRHGDLEGDCEFVMKPVSPNVLLIKIRELLDR